MKIGEVAALVGVRPSAIRYYESEGLLPAAPRIGGKREYASTVIAELRLLLGAQRAGLTLREIRGILPAFRDRKALSRSWRTIAERKLAELRDVELALRATRRFLEQSLKCECATSGVCEITRGIGDASRASRLRADVVPSRSKMRTASARLSKGALVERRVP